MSNWKLGEQISGKMFRILECITGFKRSFSVDLICSTALPSTCNLLQHMNNQSEIAFQSYYGNFELSDTPKRAHLTVATSSGIRLTCSDNGKTVELVSVPSDNILNFMVYSRQFFVFAFKDSDQKAQCWVVRRSLGTRVIDDAFCRMAPHSEPESYASSTVDGAGSMLTLQSSVDSK